MKLELLTLLVLALAGSPASGQRLGQFLRKRPVVTKPKRVTPRRLQTGTALVSQTFFVPLPEQTLFDTTFKAIRDTGVGGPVRTIISVTISTDDTVVWYDHQEDGFDADVLVATGSTTEVWGDGDMTNGCAPNKNGVAIVCSDATDELDAGDVVLLENDVPIAPRGTGILYDGGDRVQASFPIAITRVSYPTSPGSLLAGGIEVIDTRAWGTIFEAPVGPTVGSAFELTQLYIMAAEDDTVVTTPAETFTLAQGETKEISVAKGDIVTSTKPIQVDLITGDIGSSFELRWYSLVTTESWSNTYLGPVGNDKGDVQIVVYNPNATPLAVTIEKRNNAGVLTTETFTVPSKSSEFSETIGVDSGARVTAAEIFFALAVVDAPGNEIYDWGYPLVPEDQLTPEVIVGLGFGCEGNDCSNRGANGGFDDEVRSVVFVTPVADATIEVDYENDGIFDASFVVLRLQAIGISDPDQDMSGARIKATALGDPTTDVPIAAAWGQDPDRSRASDSGALDLGTVILPFVGFTATKDATITDDNGNGLLGPGDTITYTIQVSNVGSGNVGIGEVDIIDVLDADVTYIADSLVYKRGTDVQAFTGAAFPLAGPSGISNPFSFAARGGTHEIVFDCLINEDVTKTFVVNTGEVRTRNIELEFEDITDLEFEPSINIEKTVYEGQDGGASCGTGVEEMTSIDGTEITYCFVVTNNGDTFLGSVNVNDAGLSFSSIVPGGPLAPGDTRTVFFETTLTQTESSEAEASGNPELPDGSGTDLSDLSDVTDQDPAGVVLIVISPSINIEKTVYEGDDGVSGCGGAVLEVTGSFGTEVTYCFTVTNTGDTFLGSVVVNDAGLEVSNLVVPGGPLSPNETRTVVFTTTITETESGDAEATGTPFTQGSPIPGTDDVTDTDPAGVVRAENPSINIEKTVYAGDDGVSGCGGAVEEVAGSFGTEVTYCFTVTNTGDTFLGSVLVNDGPLGVSNLVVPGGPLAPGASETVVFQTTITETESSDAETSGNPVTAGNADIPDADDVDDQDDAGVVLVINPNINIEKTVYKGDLGRAGCSGSGESVTDTEGTDVTYCFTVTNTGDTFLGSVVVNDAGLGFIVSVPNGPLAPGASETVVFKTTITETEGGDAATSGNPVTAGNVGIPGGSLVTDEDDAGIVIVSINIEKTVYLGQDGGASCGGAGEMVMGELNTEVTFCLTVTNTGDVPLGNVEIVDGGINYDQPLGGAPLPPGESRVVTVERLITENQSSDAEATGTPFTQGGSPIPGANNATDSDGAQVVRMDPGASIDIEKTVYEGNNGETGCSSSSESVTGQFSTEVTFCLLVVNNGESFLKDVTVVDPILGVNQVIPSLAAGESTIITVATTITATEASDATATGTPAVDDGSPNGTATGAPPVQDSDPAGVVREENPSINIEKTVYKGDDGESGCTGADESVSGSAGTAVTYCFTVTNNGDTSLGSVVVNDGPLGVTNLVVPNGPLAPGASETVVFKATIAETGSSDADASGNPVTAGGVDIPGASNVTDADGAGVVIVAIEIQKTVYEGNTGVSGCDTASEAVTGSFGTEVTYCFTVTNTGDTPLDDVVVNDAGLDVSNLVVPGGPLAPNETRTVVFTTTITETESSEAEASGNPVNPDGTDIPGADDVTDQDDAGVVREDGEASINIEKTVYLGQNGGTSCATAGESANGELNTPVTFCFSVTNNGNTPLGDVQIVDNGAGINYDQPLAGGPLAPGETRLVVVERVILDNQTSDAEVTGTPFFQGVLIPGASPVNDADPASVVRMDPGANILIQKTVYEGDDGLIGCPSAEELAVGPVGTVVTFCFTVTNNGASNLGDVTIEDAALGLGPTNVGDLVPGEAVTIVALRTIQVDQESDALASGTPLTSGGNPTGAPPVTSQDPAAVEVGENGADIDIIKTVYEGANGVGDCPGFEQEEVTVGAIVTFCFQITNNGDTILGFIEIDDNGLSFNQVFADPLAPGETRTISTERTVLGDQESIATATGTPIFEDGSPILSLGPVNDSDDAGVFIDAPGALCD